MEESTIPPNYSVTNIIITKKELLPNTWQYSIYGYKLYRFVYLECGLLSYSRERMESLDLAKSAMPIRTCESKVPGEGTVSDTIAITHTHTHTP